VKYSHTELGGIIRKVRKDRGLKLDDLADDNVSVATISNIERGVPHVSTEKVLYLLGKLDISLDAIPTLLLNKQEEIKELKFRLLGVESLHRSDNTQKALEILDSLNIEDRHPLAAKVHLLRGRCLSKEKKLKKAERALYKAIQLASQSEDNENIESWSFNELAIVSD
jgi:transcriptional regulator with XRE-family HTH domain